MKTSEYAQTKLDDLEEVDQGSDTSISNHVTEEVPQKKMNLLIKAALIIGIFCLFVLINLRFDKVTPPPPLEPPEEPIKWEKNPTGTPLPTPVNNFPNEFWPPDSVQVEPELVSNRELRDTCRSTKWKKDIYLNCTTKRHNEYNVTISFQIGATNVKVLIVNCIRLAIDAGIGMIIPLSPLRLESDPVQFNLWTDPSFLIDVDHIFESMNRECPELVMYRSDDFHKTILDSKSIYYPQREMVPPPPIMIHEYASRMDQVMKDAGFTYDPIKPVPAVIYENLALFAWNFDTEPVIRRTLREAVQYQPRLISLGRRIVDLIDAEYFGFHLRAEQDWPHNDYVRTVQQFLDISKNHYSNITTIYVAIGDEHIEKRFQAEMAQINLKVLSKWDIAYRNQDILEEVSKLTFDQRAVLDQEILENAAYFYGNGYSALAYAVAYDRGDGVFANCKCDLLYGLWYAFKCCW
jgi:hypothetical protein